MTRLERLETNTWKSNLSKWKVVHSTKEGLRFVQVSATTEEWALNIAQMYFTDDEQLEGNFYAMRLEDN